MTVLVLKLALTPLLIGAASLGSRRWGPLVGGWLVSLPLTSGPVAFFLALDHGPAFGAAAAAASLAGSIAIVGFCVGYGLLATGPGWGVALAGALLAWLGGAALAEVGLQMPLVALVGLVAIAWRLGVAVMPRAHVAPGDVRWPAWELPVRMATGTAIVVMVTALAAQTGPTVSGLLAMVPVIGTVLAVFAHRRQGPGEAVDVLRGILTGLIGTAAFLAVVSASLVSLGIAGSFAAAALAIVAVQTVTIRAFRPLRPVLTAP